MAGGLCEAVRGLWLAYPEIGVKRLLAKLREQHPELGAATKEVRKALKALKAESESYDHACGICNDRPRAVRYPTCGHGGFCERCTIKAVRAVPTGLNCCYCR